MNNELFRLKIMLSGLQCTNQNINLFVISWVTQRFFIQLPFQSIKSKFVIFFHTKETFFLTRSLKGEGTILKSLMNVR